MVKKRREIPKHASRDLASTKCRSTVKNSTFFCADCRPSGNVLRRFRPRATTCRRNWAKSGQGNARETCAHREYIPGDQRYEQIARNTDAIKGAKAAKMCAHGSPSRARPVYRRGSPSVNPHHLSQFVFRPVLQTPTARAKEHR